MKKSFLFFNCNHSPEPLLMRQQGRTAVLQQQKYLMS